MHYLYEIGAGIIKKMIVNLHRRAVFSNHDEDFAVLAFPGPGAVAAAYAVHTVPVVQEAERIAAEAQFISQNLFHILFGNADQVHAFLDLHIVGRFVRTRKCGHRLAESAVLGSLLFGPDFVLGIADSVPVRAVVAVNGGKFVAVGPLDTGADNVIGEAVAAVVLVFFALFKDVAEGPVAVYQVRIIRIFAHRTAKEGYKVLFPVDYEGVVFPRIIEAVGYKISPVVALAAFVFRFAGAFAVLHAEADICLIRKIQGDVSGLFPGVHDEAELLSRKFKAFGRAVLADGKFRGNRGVFFGKVHDNSSLSECVNRTFNVLSQILKVNCAYRAENHLRSIY